MDAPATFYFQADVKQAGTLTDQDKMIFLGTLQRAFQIGAPYLKEKTAADLDDGATIIFLKAANGRDSGQCLLVDPDLSSAAFAAAYPKHGKTLILASFYTDAKHSTVKGTIPSGMGPNSTIFKAAFAYAKENGYESIVAITDEGNKAMHKVFEKENFIPSSPFLRENGTKTARYYIYDMAPAIGQ